MFGERGSYRRTLFVTLGVFALDRVAAVLNWETEEVWQSLTRDLKGERVWPGLPAMPELSGNTWFWIGAFAVLAVWGVLEFIYARKTRPDRNFLHSVRRRGLRIEAAGMLTTHHATDTPYEAGLVTSLNVTLVNERKRPVVIASGEAVSLKTGRTFRLYIDAQGYVPLEAIYAIPAKRRAHLAFFPTEPEIVDRPSGQRRVRPASAGAGREVTIAQFTAMHSGFDFVLNVNGRRTKYRVPNSFVENYRARESAMREDRRNVSPLEVRPDWSDASLRSGPISLTEHRSRQPPRGT